MTRTIERHEPLHLLAEGRAQAVAEFRGVPAGPLSGHGPHRVLEIADAADREAAARAFVHGDVIGHAVGNI
jgi:hypothetical protein